MQVSLQQFLALFDQSIEKSLPAPLASKRVVNIADLLSFLTTCHIGRALSETHKLLWLLMLALKIETVSGTLPPAALPLLLSGGAGLDIKTERPKPAEWVPDSVWLSLLALSYALPERWGELPELFSRSLSDWRHWYDAEAPELLRPPIAINGSFEMLALVRSLREDRTLLCAQVPLTPAHIRFAPICFRSRLYPAAALLWLSYLPSLPLVLLSSILSFSLTLPPSLRSLTLTLSPSLAPLPPSHPPPISPLPPPHPPSSAQEYIAAVLGQRFTEPRPLELREVAEEAGCRCPVVAILFPGSDPTPAILDLARKLKRSVRTLSLGQAQEAAARKLLSTGCTQGAWLLLQNCHLALSFMSEIESSLLKADEIHSEFQLWLTSEAHPDFPIGLLHISLKISSEPPAGVRGGLKHAYNFITQDMFDAQAQPQWRLVLYTLTFLHTIAMERRKFGSLGFNLPYEFNQADLFICIQYLQNYLV